MPTFVLRDGQMVDKATGAPMVDRNDWSPTAPQIQSDYEGYQSPVTGKWVEGKRARRYDLESNNCVDARELPSLGGKFKNKHFTAKRGLNVTTD